MPGHTNKKQSQRTKGNVRPSSSSQAAQLLVTTGTAPTGFIGFSGSPGYVPASQVFDDIDNTLDADFRLVLRKLTKKDSTTKVKALQEFSVLCEEKDIEHLKAVLPFWPRIYNKVALDVDHKVRECTQQSMNTLVLRVRKNLAPYLKSLMGSWLLCQCDTYPTVSTAAQQAFQTAFPPAKQTDALVFCKSVVTEYLVDNLLNQTPNTLSDSTTTEQDDMVNKYNRVLTSSLLALRKLITAIPANQIEDLKHHMQNLLKDGKFWKHGKSTITSIKAAMYTFLAGLCQTMPDVAQEFSKKLSPFILNNIDERDPVICPAVWEAVLSLVNFVKECWTDVSIEKSLWPKLRNLLENGCYGNCSLIAPDLLPFISKVPPDLLKEENKIYVEFLNHMKLGLSKEQVQTNSSECSAFVRAFIECSQFMMKEVTSTGSDLTFLKIILHDQLLPVVVSSIIEKESELYKSPLYCMMGNALEKLENVATDDVRKTLLSYWSELSDKVKERLSEEVQDDSMRVVDRVMLLVKNLVYPQLTEKVKPSVDMNLFDLSPKSQDRIKLTKGMSTFVQKLSIHGFQNAHKQWNPPSLHLFAALMEIEPAEDTIKLVIESCHGDIETDKSHSNYFVFNVCLPWLEHAQSEENAADQKQIISIICTFIALLENSSLTVLLQTLTETVQNFEAFYHLLTKCIKLQSEFSSIKTWLNSDILGNKLVDIATVVCKESTKPVVDNQSSIQFGWDVISLVLTADQNSDQVIREDHIKQILHIVHQTLLSLGDNSDPNNTDIAVKFVSKATQSFFISSKNCLLLPSAEDLLITLFTISLDDTYKVSDETLSESELVWTTGIGSIVRQTGGLIKDGGLLQKAVNVVKDTVISVQQIQIFDRIIKTVDKLLTVVKESLPGDRGDNPIVSNLVQNLYTQEMVAPRKVLDYLITKGDLSYLSMNQTLGSDASFSQILYSALYNARLLCWSVVKADEQETRSVELDPKQITLLLSVLHSMNIVNQWKDINNIVHVNLSLSQSISILETLVSTLIQKLTENSKKYLLTSALDSAADKGSFWCLALQSLMAMYSKDTVFTLDFNSLLDRCSELDENKVQVLQVAAPYLTTENKHTLAEIMVARMMSAEPIFPVNGGIQALAVLNSIVTETGEVDSCRDLIEASMSQIMTWKEDKDDFLLYSSDIGQSRSDIIFANIEIMKFLQQTVSLVSIYLTDKEWDFIMCSVVSFVQSIEESVERLPTSVEVQIFTCTTCRLLTTVARCLQTDVEKSIFPPNLVTEWNEFFSEGIFGALLPLFVKTAENHTESITGQIYLLLKSLSLSVCQCPKQQVLDHKLAAYLKADDTSGLPDSLQTLLNHVCPLLSHDFREVQLAAFHLLYSIIPELPQYEKESKDSTEEEVSRCPPQQLMTILVDGSKLEVLSSSLNVDQYLKITPFTDDYTLALSYLLTWRLLLYFFKSSTAEIRQEYAIYFRQTGLVHQLLSNIYRLMPDNPTQDTKVMFDRNFSLNVANAATDKDIPYLSCYVYRHALQTVPAMVRTWWKEQDRKTINYVDRFTSKHVSQILCTEEIQPVSKTDIQLENITIKTRPITREVIATYSLEEVTIEMVIALPENYPLGTITVVSEKRVGVSAATWDKWLLQLNVFLQYQNGSIIDGLRIWKRNIDKRFEGVEDCMICFSVIHGTNYQLPRLTCKTCKKKFHSACLYKWFQTSHNSTCPLCRNLF
ncbi:E3 ubiquitin-protein ligase listerin-like [Mytilus californianus]|uniref:E3 ubiquitin-protein ligase listerin-like n=1 Tax=Mytilus californianus TaxID=6549 RepID=UPI0022452D6A|nr:E3 ubiquitin-protein ligase listerin-like [Mytilus californianus]